jgi:CRP/FNR family transcriptional regulator, cyclic AMP receptor protein
MQNSTENQRLIERFGRDYKSGEMIFVEDQEAEKIYMILTGRTRLIKRVRSVERDLVVLKAGDIFGEIALLGGCRHPFSAVSLGDCRVLEFNAKDFENLLREQSDIAIKFIIQLVRRIQASEERIENMMLKDSQSKILNTLIKLSESRSDTEERIMISLSPIELSSRIGLDVDSVKRGILYLRENGYLRIVDEKIEVYDVEALRKMYRLMGMKEELQRG